MIYNGYDGLHFQGGYATSPNDTSWTKSPDPILLYGQPGRWDYPRVQPGSVVFNSNTAKYYLFYSGGAQYNWRIGYATSSTFSGPWTKDTSILIDVTPGSWENNFVGFPSVIEDSDSNLYKMWYSSQTSTGPYGIGYATSDKIPSSVEGDEVSLPQKFYLEQNFPNPFNPSTKIKYSVPKSSKVIIKVFDVLGNEIETLVNEEKPTGIYEITWYAEQLPSGVYFYQLKAGSFVSTKKMILLK